MTRSFILLLAFFGLCGAATAGKIKPSSIELARAIKSHTNQPVQTGNVRAINCSGFPEEPTEFECRWEQLAKGQWRRFSAYLAVDKSGWIIIDGPHPE